MTFFQSLVTMLGFMVAAIFVQNSIFTRGLGVSRLIKLVNDSAVDSVIFCLILTVTLVANAPLTYLVNNYLSQERFWYRNYIRPFFFCVCIIIVMLVVMVLITVFKIPRAKEISALLPMASFNTAILGPLLISSSQKFSMAESIGFALGSGIGYGFAALIVSEGQRKLNNRRVPATFRGLPINLIYIGILALAIYGLTGHLIVI